MRLPSGTKFTGKNILITGAGRGIGKRLALGFARLGARIVLVGRSKGQLDIAHIEIEQGGGNALRVTADVTDEEQLRTGVERAGVAFSGSPDVLICAAAVSGPLAPFGKSTLNEWKNALNINLTGVVNSCSAVLPSMIEKRSGKILVLACDSDAAPRGNFSAYETSKTALVRFVECLSVELSYHNVQINCFDPGPTYTSLTDETIEAEEMLESKVVAVAKETRSTGGTSPDLQMEHAVFLASEASNHITGKLIHVTDDWKKLKNAQLRPDLLTLRRVAK